MVSPALQAERLTKGAEAAVYLVVNSKSSSVLTPGPHHQTVGAPLRVTHSQALPRSLQTERWWAGLQGLVSNIVESLGNISGVFMQIPS